MIWIITSPERIHEEERIIAALLSAGASRVLLRKPGWNTEAYVSLLDKINPDCYRHILIRDQPTLANQYRLAGVHWSGEAKTSGEAEQHSRSNSASHLYSESSTGIHSSAEIPSTPKRFSTLLLSPVFDSISKPGYHGLYGGQLANKDDRPVLALGGVDHTNIIFLKQWHFDGAALLGAIWKTPAKAIENYNRIQQLWNKSDHM
ncbi:thiamine phosphate synthase [Chitinophaga sp. 22321]|uniref:Thiamine phosphate synthase n=1 Tax=Chitinophaga hostae TaxID=2831022 RepID=A0ABS5ISP6_9BACT|nr:thiamine phosphate synthase [Chitinophaga hostae]MBS0025985.1 thiamine phosphate synthase [Chitinophaga hostae]